MKEIMEQFTYIEDGDFGICVDLRYASEANFAGRVINGYQNTDPKRAYMTKSAAEAIVAVQKDLMEEGYSLIIYDSYRPITAVRDFAKWARDLTEQNTKPYYYPTVNKNELFEEGYIAYYSGHSRGSTIDLSLITNEKKATYKAPYKIGDLNDRKVHFKMKNSDDSQLITREFTILEDGSVYMGSHFDFLDPAAHVYNMEEADKEAHNNRMLLRNSMMKQGFKPYECEWWHFTKDDEPITKIYLDIAFDEFTVESYLSLA